MADLTDFLNISNLFKSFDGMLAIDNVSFHLGKGEIVGIIGPNGAGKTTLFNLITGFLQPTTGQIVFRGHVLKGMNPDQICRLGIARTFQIEQPFLELTACENVMIGAFNRNSATSTVRAKALQILGNLGMAEKEKILAKHLTTSERRRLELARCLATEPELMLLDESMGGLTNVEIQEVVNLIRKLRDSGITFLIIEHIISAIKQLADRIIVLNYGQKLADGNADEVLKNEKVLQAYLGAEIQND